MTQRVQAGASAGEAAMLLIFLAASLVVVAAIVVLGDVDQWWVLALVYAFYVAITAAVSISIARFLRDDGEPG